MFNFLFLLVFIFNTLLFAANSIYFNDLVSLKYNFAQANKENVLFVIKQIIPLHYYILMFVLLGIIFLFARVNMKGFDVLEKQVKRHIFLIFLTFLTFSIILSLFSYDKVVNQYGTTLVYAANNLKNKEINLNITHNVTVNKWLFDNSIKNYTDVSVPKNQKILVFVMEQTTLDAFLEAVNDIPEDKNFFKLTYNQSIYFKNYYTQNQDSRTSIWDMLNSVFIPFECYLSNWNKYYGSVLSSNNLVQFFQSKGYKTVAVSSVYTPNLILAAYPWDDLIYLKEFDENNPDFICLHEFEFQQGCEDKILLPDIKKFLLENKNKSIFMLQELIAGHGEDFVKLLGRHQIYYYNDYFLEIYNFLKENDLLENTNIIIVSDHGNKGYELKRLSDYRIPLVIINQNIKGHLDVNELFTHNDFKNILIDFLNGKPFKKRVNSTYIIGQTASNELAYVDDRGNYFLGLLKSNDFILKDSKGFSLDDIKEKIELLLAYRNLMQNESMQQNNYCKYCDRNLKLVESKRVS